MEQLSLLEQSRLATPGISDEDHVVLVAERLTRELSLKPPLGVDIVASAQGISRVEIVDQPWAGCLATANGRLVIRLRNTDPEVRQRFSGFHEVAHTFLPGFALRTQFRCDPGDARRSVEEHLCDVGASELLFPRRFFAQDLRSAAFGMDTVELLADKYQGSLEATTRRVVDLSPCDSLMVVLEVRKKPSERWDSSAVPRLRVRYSHGRGQWPFIPRHKSVSRGGIPERCLSQGLAKGQSQLDGLVPEFEDTVGVSALACPFLDSDGLQRKRVIALYHKLGGGGRMRVSGCRRRP